MVVHTFNSSVHKAETNWSLWVEASLLYTGSSGTVRATRYRDCVRKNKKKESELEVGWQGKFSKPALLTYLSQVSATSTPMKNTTRGSNAWTYWHLSFRIPRLLPSLHSNCKAATLTPVRSKPRDHCWLHEVIVDSMCLTPQCEMRHCSTVLTTSYLFSVLQLRLTDEILSMSLTQFDLQPLCHLPFNFYPTVTF